jgi:hypothetical protein
LLERGQELAFSWMGTGAVDRLPAGSDDCAFEVETYGSLGYQRTRYKSGICSVYIRHTEKDEHFRSFSFGSNGSLMVFNQFSESGHDNGARLFYFFPRSQSVPRFVPLPEAGEVAVQTSSGSQVRFSTADAMITGTSPDLELTIKDDIVPGNAGGVEVIRWSGVYLDVGFSMREQPYYKRPNGEAWFKDAEGHACKVQNKEIYDYTNPEEPRFKLSDDQIALAFLESRCPELETSSLRPKPAEGHDAPPVRLGAEVPTGPHSGSAY